MCDECAPDHIGHDSVLPHEEHPELIRMRLGLPSAIDRKWGQQRVQRVRAAPAQPARAADPDARCLLTDRDPGIDDPNVYDDFEKHPLHGVLLLHSNANLSVFEELRSVLEYPEAENRAELLRTTAEKFEKIIDDIGEAGPRIMQAHAAATSADRELLCCAACGLRDFMVNPTRHTLSECTRLLAFNAEVPQDRARSELIARAALSADAISGITFDNVFSTFVDPATGKRFHLHPEFVDPPSAATHKDEYSCILCHTCSDAVKKKATKKSTIMYDRPANSLARGYDRGCLARVGIPTLTPVEVACIAPHRVYMVVQKFSGANAGSNSQPVLKGQCITFWAGTHSLRSCYNAIPLPQKA